MGSLRAAVLFAAFLLVAVVGGARAAEPFRPTGGLAFSPAAPVDPAGTSVQPNLALGQDAHELRVAVHLDELDQLRPVVVGHPVAGLDLAATLHVLEELLLRHNPSLPNDR